METERGVVAKDDATAEVCLRHRVAPQIREPRLDVKVRATCVLLPL